MDGSIGLNVDRLYNTNMRVFRNISIYETHTCVITMRVFYFYTSGAGNLISGLSYF